MTERRTGGSGLDLSALANVDLYRRNAFRLSGLPVDASLRQIRRRATEVEVAERLGDTGSIAGDGLFPVTPHPAAEEVLTALQRLRDPNRRLLEEWFWLWPIPDHPTEDARLDDVKRSWSELVGTGSEHAGTAAHNLAVAAHLKLLEVGRGSRSLEGAWKSAYRAWRRVIDDERCWTWLEGRVEAIADPQLKVGAVAELRSGLPAMLLEIHAGLVVSLVAGHPTRAAMHVAAIRASGFDRELVDEALTGAVQGETSRLRALAGRAREAVLAREPFEPVAKSIVEGSKADLAAVRAVLGDDHPVLAGVTDRLAGGLRECVIAGVNRSGVAATVDRRKEYATAIRWLDKALGIAGEGHVREQITADLTTLLHNLVLACCNAAIAKPKGAKTYTIEAERLLVQRTREPMSRLRKLDRAMHDSLCDEVAGTSFVMLVDYANHHGPSATVANAVLPGLEKALSLVKGRDLEGRIRKAIRDIESILEHERPGYRTAPRPTGGQFPGFARNEWNAFGDRSDPYLGSTGQDDFVDRFAPPIGGTAGACALCGEHTRSKRSVQLYRLRPRGGGSEIKWVEVSCCPDCRHKGLAMAHLRLGVFLIDTAAFVILALVLFLGSVTLEGTGTTLGIMLALDLIMRGTLTFRRDRQVSVAEQPELAQLLREQWTIVR